MGGFLRGIVALSGIWALCELLLPEGGVQKMARLVISLLVMTVLVASLVDTLKGLAAGGGSLRVDALGDVAYESAEAQSATTAEAGYTYAYLRSLANQAEDACVRLARNAGYTARARVYLQASGALERIELAVGESPDRPPLISREQLRQAITKAFQAEDSRVRLSADGDEAR